MNRSISKLISAAHAERHSWKQDVCVYLAVYCNTPHPSTNEAQSFSLENSFGHAYGSLTLKVKLNRQTMRSKLLISWQNNKWKCMQTSITMQSHIVLPTKNSRYDKMPYKITAIKCSMVTAKAQNNTENQKSLFLQRDAINSNPIADGRGRRDGWRYGHQHPLQANPNQQSTAAKQTLSHQIKQTPTSETCRFLSWLKLSTKMTLDYLD